MVSPVSEPTAPSSDTIVEIPQGDLAGRDVEVLHSKKRYCSDNGVLAWRVLLATIILGSILVGGGIGYGLKKHDWHGASVLIAAGGFSVFIGWVFFAFIHPRGGCCC